MPQHWENSNWTEVGYSRKLSSFLEGVFKSHVGHTPKTPHLYRTKTSVLQRRDFSQLLSSLGGNLSALKQEMTADYSSFLIAVPDPSVRPQSYRSVLSEPLLQVWPLLCFSVMISLGSCTNPVKVKKHPRIWSENYQGWYVMIFWFIWVTLYLRGFDTFVVVCMWEILKLYFKRFYCVAGEVSWVFGKWSVCLVSEMSCRIHVRKVFYQEFVCYLSLFSGPRKSWKEDKQIFVCPGEILENME